jgi:hypothetical protein
MHSIKNISERNKIDTQSKADTCISKSDYNLKSGCTYTVKRVDEVVRHPHLVTQDQNTQVSNKFFDIPVENFTINIELFRHFSQVSN